MHFSKLIENLTPEETRGDLDQPVTGVAYDSRAVKEGDVFLAMRGERTDGHKYIKAALEAGAAGIVLEEFPEDWPEDAEQRVAVARFRTVRAVAAEIAAQFYGRPSDGMKVIGITGTNGKTTTAWLVKHLCDNALLRAGYLGTIGYYIGEEQHKADRTTPEAPDLQRMLSEMRDAGCRAASLEVSSHAIHQHRSGAIDFAAMVFMNLTQDHLDYHDTMENYYQAKARVFYEMAERRKGKGVILINMDDSYGSRLLREVREKAKDSGSKVRIQTFGMSNAADFRATNLRITREGMQFALEALGRSYLVRSKLIGRFNLSNTLAALGAVHALGVDLRTAIKAMETIPQVPGRMEAVEARESFNIFIDYAHTDDALKNVLQTCQDLPHKRLRVVFGCGGDRDKGKRPRMARVVEQYADHAYVTSDNPRTEDPEAILDDILTGFKKRNYTVITDRREAIFQAIDEARPGDIVLIAGKGHEDYQETAEGRRHFLDSEVAAIALQERHRRIAGQQQRERQEERRYHEDWAREQDRERQWEEDDRRR